MAFVVVLSWSRQIFLRFYLNQRMEASCCAAMWPPSRPGARCPGSCSDNLRRQCWSAGAMRSVSIPPCWLCPHTTTLNPARSR